MPEQLHKLLKHDMTNSTTNVKMNFFEEMKDVVLNGDFDLVIFCKTIVTFILGKGWYNNTFTRTIEVDENFNSKHISAAKRLGSVKISSK